MRTSITPSPRSSAALVLREAKRLHRAARSESLSQSLPVLRRLIGCRVLAGLSLPALHRTRTVVQRKHVLRMLAVEAGHANWESYAEALRALPLERLVHFDILRQGAGHLNLWFPSVEAAREHAGPQGAVIAVGRQAVILLDG